MGWEVPSGGTAALCWKPQLRTRIPGLSEAVAEGGLLALLLLGYPLSVGSWLQDRAGFPLESWCPSATANPPMKLSRGWKWA